MVVTETRNGPNILGEDETPRIADTTMKVGELVVAQAAYGWSPEELHFQFPHRTLGQIHSALAYYWDHREALDQEIARRLSTTEQWRQQVNPSPLYQRSRERGHA